VEISHGCYSGPLNGFRRLCLVWAEVAGYGTMDYSDVGGGLLPKIDYSAFSPEDYQGEWPEGAPDDPLLILLVHDEHAGRIKVSHCPYLADRLESLEAVLMKANVTAFVLATQIFVRGLRTAAHYKQDVVFS
jgi:hypothetical protein